MGRAGRKRKAAQRTKSDQISRAGVPKWDYGNDRVQQRREAFQVFQGGKANEHIGDTIGRLWAAGLLDGTAYDPAVLRDIGRRYAGLYWIYYPSASGTASYEPRERTTGNQGWYDPMGKTFEQLDALLFNSGRKSYDATQAITVNVYWFPDDNPDWVARLINGALRRNGKAITGLLPTQADQDRLTLAKAGLSAMIG